MLLKYYQMSNQAIKKISKKQAKKLLYDKFEEALSDYKKDVKPKKFKSKLRKASKLFASDIAKVGAKPKSKIKKIRKKLTKRKPAHHQAEGENGAVAEA
jgi:hypothetical protein